MRPQAMTNRGLVYSLFDLNHMAEVPCAAFGSPISGFNLYHSRHSPPCAARGWRQHFQAAAGRTESPAVKGAGSLRKLQRANQGGGVQTPSGVVISLQ